MLLVTIKKSKDYKTETIMTQELISKWKGVVVTNMLYVMIGIIYLQ